MNYWSPISSLRVRLKKSINGKHAVNPDYFTWTPVGFPTNLLEKLMDFKKHYNKGRLSTYQSSTHTNTTMLKIHGHICICWTFIFKTNFTYLFMCVAEIAKSVHHESTYLFCHVMYTTYTKLTTILL